MRDAGIKIPNTDESWGPWWDKQWKKATTHKKDNDYYGKPSVWNLIRRTFNDVTGNDTYQAEPLPIGGTLSQTDNSLGARLDRAVTKWQREGDPVRDVVLLAMPGPSSKVAKPIANVVKETLPRLSARAWVPTSRIVSNGVRLGPKTATAIDAGLAGSATGASMYDWYQNGPSVDNVLGTTLGVGGLAFEAAPTIMEGYNAGKKAYNTYQLARSMNKTIDASKITPTRVISKTIQLETPPLSASPAIGREWREVATAIHNKPFIEAYNRWNRFGYPEIPKRLKFDTPKLEAFIKGQLNRHNTFARGVQVLPDEKRALEASLGRKLTDDEFLRIAATTPRSNGEGQAALWISPYTELASIYGNGKTALVRRPFKLGSDRMKWFDEASFDVQHNPLGVGEYTDIMAPWNSKPVIDWNGFPKYSVSTIPESELVSPTKMNFLEFVKGSKHMNNRTSLNSNPFFTKGENHFDPESGQWIIDTYKGFSSDNNTTAVSNLQKFIDDYLQRLNAQNHKTQDIKLPTIRVIDPQNDLYDRVKISSNAGAWYNPITNDVTLRRSVNQVDYGLLNHEFLGHGFRYSLANSSNSRWPYSRDIFNKGVQLQLDNPNIDVNIPYKPLQLNSQEVTLLQDSYPWINNFKGIGKHTLSEQAAVNTQFRAKISQKNNYVTGKELDKAIDNTEPGVILKMLQEQPYTSSITDDISKITRMNSDDIIFLSSEDLNKLAQKHPELKTIANKVKNTMKKVAIVGGITGAASTQKHKNGGMIRRFQNSGKVEPSFWDRMDNWAARAEIPMAIGATAATLATAYSGGAAFGTYGIVSAGTRNLIDAAPVDNTRVAQHRIYRKGGVIPDPIKGRFTFKRNQIVKDAEQLNGKKDMRKKLVKSDVVTNKKKRVRKGQEGLKFATYAPIETPLYEPDEISNPFSEYNFPTQYKEVYVERPQGQEVIIEAEPIKQETSKQQKVSAPKVTTQFGSRKDFVNTLYSHLYKALQENGIDAKTWAPILTAHTSIESGWGNQLSRKNNNFGGIKGKGSGMVKTKEYSPERGYYITNDSFKSYASIDDFANDFVKMLKNRFRAFDGTPNQYLANLKKHRYFTARLEDYQKIFNSRLRTVNSLLSL